MPPEQLDVKPRAAEKFPDVETNKSVLKLDEVDLEIVSSNIENTIRPYDTVL